MESHNCLTCGTIISTLFFYCFECRQERASAAASASRKAKEARSVAAAPLGQPLDVLGYLRPF